jgi:hypothetical protein
MDQREYDSRLKQIADDLEDTQRWASRIKSQRFQRVLNRFCVVLAAIVCATFIPSFFGRHADEQVIKALLCSGAAYGIGRIAAWAVKGFHE